MKYGLLTITLIFSLLLVSCGKEEALPTAVNSSEIASPQSPQQQDA